MKSMLDDAAAYAIADGRIDLTEVLHRAQDAQVARHRAVRRRTACTALAAAAAIALIAVLLPLGSVNRSEGIPADQPSPLPAVTGLPVSWYYAPPWTPPVTRHPMIAAVMVLSARLQNGSLAYDNRGPVLVSADGSRYASLPWGRHDGGVALSPDGRRVAWWTADRDSTGPLPIVVHTLTLSTGQSREVSIPRGVPVSMTWAHNDVWFTAQEEPDTPSAENTTSLNRIWRIEPQSGRVTEICACGPATLGVTPDGALLSSGDRMGQAVPSSTRYLPPPLPAGWHAVPQTPGIAAETIIADPAGSGMALVARDPQRGWAVLTGSTRVAIPVSTEPITGVHLLGWGRGGLVMRVETSQGPGYSTHRSVRILDVSTSRFTVVSRPHEGNQSVPVAVAAGLITTAEAIAAPVPEFQSRDRSHLAFLRDRGWSRYHGPIEIGAVAVVALLSGYVVYRRRRRLPPPESA